MNESILNALLQLFAIIANTDHKDGLSFKGRNIVKSYLNQHLNSKLTNRYLKQFDTYIESAKEYLPSSVTSQKTTNKEDVIAICEHINKGLVQREKFIVFLRLLEFINEDDVMTKRELDFVKTVSGTFNITESAHNNTRTFVIDSLSGKIDEDKVLIICAKKQSSVKGINCIQNKGLEGSITILHHAATNTFVFNYSGSGVLYLNGHIIIPGRNHILDQGALITGPKISPVYYSDILGKFMLKEDVPKIRFTASDIEFRFKNSPNGIQKFTFSKESGHLIGIMGGSGVGKSTLLNILSGKMKPQKGRILINGYDIHKDKEILSGLIGYVPQDDLLMEDLSVFQNLYLNAKLCFKDLTESEILRKVNQVLIDLELDDISKLKVGNPLKKYISGGQRKRLNFALELIREPSILFIDEPTSGLSSLDSEKVMYLLKEQTLKGKLVIVNIHQPFSDIFKLFDRILIMDKGGYVIYKGNPIDALTYFKSQSNYVNADEGQCLNCGNVTPEEILRMVEVKEVDEFGKLTKKRKVSPEEWHKTYKKKIESKAEIKSPNEKLPPVTTKVPNSLVQFRIFTIRNLLSKIANRQYLLINFLEAPLLAVIISLFTKYIRDLSPTGIYVFQDNVNLPAYMFMAVVVALFMGLMVSAEEIIRDRKILERESFLNLSRLSYLNSKVLILFIISAIQTLSFVLIANYILGIKGMTLPYWLVLFTTSCFANMLGLNLSSGLNSVISIYILIPFIVVPQLLLSGVIVDFDRLNKVFRNPVYVPAIGDVMTTRWSYEALAVHQYKNNKYQKKFYPHEKVRRNASYQALYLIPKLQNKINETLRDTELNTNQEQIDANLKMLTEGIKDSYKQYGWPEYKELVNLRPEVFDSALAGNILDYLALRKFQAQKIENSAMRELDKMFEEIEAVPSGKDDLIKLRLDYFNSRLDELVTNKTRINKIIELDNRVIRKADPIYMDPVGNYGRAHMYAPVKKIGQWSIDTLWFNTMVIWLTILFLYLLLVFDFLRKAINWFGEKRSP